MQPVAISNRRLVAADDGGVSFRWKDYRIDGPGRWKTMAIAPHEFIRRFLMHALPKGFGGDLPTFVFARIAATDPTFRYDSIWTSLLQDNFR